MLSHSLNNRFGRFELWKKEILILCRRLRLKLFWFSLSISCSILTRWLNQWRGWKSHSRVLLAFDKKVKCLLTVTMSDSFANLIHCRNRCINDIRKSTKVSLVIGVEHKSYEINLLPEFSTFNLFTSWTTTMLQANLVLVVLRHRKLYIFISRTLTLFYFSKILWPLKMS